MRQYSVEVCYPESPNYRKGDQTSSVIMKVQEGETFEVVFGVFLIQLAQQRGKFMNISGPMVT